MKKIPLLTATIIEEPPKIFTGYINEVKGCVSQGSSIKEVKKDLLQIYWIKRSVEEKIKKEKID
jgi:predicted RNase H-like HicB family nuclease